MGVPTFLPLLAIKLLFIVTTVANCPSSPRAEIIIWGFFIVIGQALTFGQWSGPFVYLTLHNIYRPNYRKEDQTKGRKEVNVDENSTVEEADQTENALKADKASNLLAKQTAGKV